jgi:hypothetical protein
MCALSKKQKRRKRLGKKIYQANVRYGHHKEQEVKIVVDDLIQNDPQFSWIISARISEPNSKEDREKKDLILETDIGDLFFQIKGGVYAGQRFLKSYHARTSIGLIILQHGLSKKQFEDRIKGVILKERDKILKLRNYS